MARLMRWLICSWRGHAVEVDSFTYSSDYGMETEATAYCTRCDWWENI